MKKTFHIIGSLVGIGFLMTSASSFAETGFQFPLPEGSHRVTSGYEDHHHRLGTEHKSLDLQVAEIPDVYLNQVSQEIREKGARCYSYGAPILAVRDGEVIFVEDLVDAYKDKSYGNYVIVRHADGSTSLYAHMIRHTNSLYVKKGDRVVAGQILGLMGATGTIISSQSPCNSDIPAGTHLHFEARNYLDSSGKPLSMEPLGPSENNGISPGRVLTSHTLAHDPKSVYAGHHVGKYPYILKLEKVKSLTPLQAPANSEVRFELFGESFSENSSLKLSFCSSQSFHVIDDHHAFITCQTKNETGLQEGIFSNPDQPDGILKYQVELQSSPSSTPSVSEVNFITAKPGEFMSFHVLGKNLPGDLKVKISAKNYPGLEGQCDTGDAFFFLSPGSIKTQCRLPLNLGPVEQKNDQPFTITVSHGGQILVTKNFEINYGISAANLLPRTALYYTPTRFTISGKNVHRTTVFFIEGCEKKDLKIISRKYDALILECLIQPKPNTDLSTINGKTFPHLFLFKTQSRFDEQGLNIFDDEEDRSHVVVSGFIDVTYDKEERVESISPQQAIIGKPTVFTVSGKNLPYGDQNPKAYSVWLDHCSAGDKGIQIIPSSYTPYGFDFQCVPEFNKAPLKEKSDFDLNTVLQKCDTILEQKWTEFEKNSALEKCYESENKAVKMSMWGYFDRFFEALPVRKLHVKKAQDEQKVVVSEQSVKFVSALYDFIQQEESFQFQYERKDGDFIINGTAAVKKVLAGEITRKNRHQTITVLGENLPETLDMVSEECAQKAITYGSSEHFEFVCLLKKVPVQEIRIIDTKIQSELSRTYTDLVEVYEAEASPDGKKTFVHLRGVNFTPNMALSSDNCLNFTSILDPSSTEMVYHCDLNVGLFSKSDSLDLKVTSADGVLLFDGVVKIQPRVMPLVAPSISELTETKEVKTPVAKGDLQLVDTPLFQSKLITLICEASDDDLFFLGECRMSSDFIREAFVNASYDKQVRLAVMEGSFDTRLGKAVDDFAANKLLGLKLNPASGNGLIILDIDDQSLLLNGQVKAIGFDASEVLGFPFVFDLYDYQGQLIVTYPYFDVRKAREKSKIVFGIGQVPGEHITLFQEESAELKKRIEENMKAINVALNKKKIEIGAKLVGSIENTTLKKLTRTSYIKILKALEIVPDAVGFYDNYDFIAKGRLKSEPFRPPSWPENVSWGVEANLATLDVDFIAKKAQLKIKGDALNSLSLLNNDILKTDRGLINLGLTIALNEENGRIDLDQVEVRLPGDFASVGADAHVIQIFNPADLAIWGNIKSHISVGPLELAKAGAGFRYDPNMEYFIGDQKTLGLLELNSQMKMVALLATGRAVFTLPERKEMVMDVGGRLDFDFLGYNKFLGDALGRGRISADSMKACFNSQTGTFEFKIPYYAKLPFLAITTDDTITFRGGVSADVRVNLKGNDTNLDYLAFSGQATDKTRIGFQYDSKKNWLSAFSRFDDVCHDAPGQEFLKNILSRPPTKDSPMRLSRQNQLAHFLPPLYVHR